MKKALFVYNPLSGHRNIQTRLDYVIELFMQRNILIQPYRITGGDEERLLRVIQREKYSFIIVSGGDGTVNSMANLLLKNNIDIPMGVVPTGTCNDFARSINIPANFKKCMEIILRGNTISIDVGLLNDEKYFLGTCAGGIFVDVSYNTNSELKKNLGPLAYYLTALNELVNIKPLKLKIRTDTEEIEQNSLLFLILNGKHAAGFNNISNEADISDGYMDIIVIKSCLHIDLVGMLINALKSDLINNKNVMCIRTKYCEISSDVPVALSVDGEKWNPLPVTVSFKHQALKVFA